MTRVEFIRRTLIHLANGNPTSAWLNAEARAFAMLPLALHRLAHAVNNDAKNRYLLEQTYSVTLSGTPQSGNLLTATGSVTGAADMYIRSVTQNGYVKDTIGQQLTYIKDALEFENYVTPGLFYYTISNNGRIYVRSGNSGDYLTDAVDIIGPLTIRAVWLPKAGTIQFIPDELIDLAISIFASVLTTGGQAPIAAQGKEE